MKIKKVKVGIKAIQAALHEFVDTGKALQKGQKVKKKPEFTLPAWKFLVEH
jgi:hypothetical protein